MIDFSFAHDELKDKYSSTMRSKAGLKTITKISEKSQANGIEVEAVKRRSKIEKIVN